MLKDKNMDKEIVQEIDKNKRDFVKKFGTYAASAPLAAIMLMSPSTSQAVSSQGLAHGKGHNK